jgi:hypothetical protein
LDELIALLDEEAETRESRYRTQLVQVMRDLELRACLSGASALTVALIHVSQKRLSINEMEPRPN